MNFTAEQYHQLLQLLSNNNIISSQVNSSIFEGVLNSYSKPFSFKHFCANVYKPSNLLHKHKSWIVDSGATDHICSNQSFFESMSKLALPHLIGLPNGNDTSINYVGDFEINESIILHGFLYVPDFKYNLVLIPKITSHLKTFTIFTDENYLLQDHSLKNKFSLGILGKRVNDLYVFDHYDLKTSLKFNLYVFTSSLSCQTSIFNPCKSSNTILWHNRLGHIPVAKLKILSLVTSNCHDSDDHSCIIFYKVKQN